jgi:flagellar motor protein MotB
VLEAPRPTGLLVVLAMLLATAVACGVTVVFLYAQLREAEAASARVAARSAELEHSAVALGAKVQGLERRELGLTQLLDDLGSRQRARDAASAERTSTLDTLGVVLHPLVKRGDALLREETEGVDIQLGERALFVSGSARLSNAGTRLLRQVATGLPDSQWRVDVVGRGPSFVTGPLEAAAEKARLASERAAAVSSYLVRRAGLAEQRVSAAVYGPVRRRPGEPSALKRSSIELHLLAPVPDLDRPGTTTASTTAVPSTKP